MLQALALARRSRGAGSSNISQQTSRSTPHVLLPRSGDDARPHLIITLVDDVGYNDVGWHNPLAKTPFLNSLISSSTEPTVELMRHYTYCICSPTRASLLTGRAPAHVNQQNENVEFPDMTDKHLGGGSGMTLRPPEDGKDYRVGGMDLRMRTLPQLLKGAGYRTAHVGKWHLGARQFSQTPSRRGFDESFAYLSGGMHSHLTHFMAPYPWLACSKHSTVHGVDLWENETPVRDHRGVHSCHLFATRAVNIISRHDPKEKLFMYAALAEAHGPYDPVPGHSKPTIADSDGTEYLSNVQSYYAMVSCADEATRNITLALQRQGMWQNTLMLWSSDNGAKRLIGSNAPFRGYKADMLEGGVRVPALLLGGALPQSAPPRYAGPVHIADWLATFAALAGIDDPSDPDAVKHGLPDIDSINLWPALTGANDMGSKRDQVLLGTHIFKCRHAALIRGPWKLIFNNYLESAPSRGPACMVKKNFALYNLDDDPYEQDDVSEAHPYIRNELFTRLTELSKGSYQTGVTEQYLLPGENVSAPYAEVCAAAAREEQEGYAHLQGSFEEQEGGTRLQPPRTYDADRSAAGVAFVGLRTYSSTVIQ